MRSLIFDHVRALSWQPTWVIVSGSCHERQQTDGSGGGSTEGRRRKGDKDRERVKKETQRDFKRETAEERNLYRRRGSAGVGVGGGLAEV